LPKESLALRRDVVTRGVLAWAGSAVAGCWIGTQIAAARMGYSERLKGVLVTRQGSAWWWWGVALVTTGVIAVLLGATEKNGRRRGAALATGGLVGLAGWIGTQAARGAVYEPLELLAWEWSYRHYPVAREAMEPGAWFASVVLVVGGVLAGWGILRTRAKIPAGGDVHGSARWATRQEVRGSGMTRRKNEPPPENGIFLGKIDVGSGGREELWDTGPGHVFFFAPTRSGKGVGAVIPNLLHWPESALIHDVKGENYELTAGYRESELGHVCLRFDPTAEGTRSARYNPLMEIRRGDLEVRDARNVADILVDPNGDKARDHWDRTSHALLMGVILHVLYAEQEKSLGGCLRFLSRPGEGIDEALEAMLTYPHLGPGRPHPVVAGIAQEVRDKAANERSGVVSTALSFLSIYRDPTVDGNTSVSDFTINDLMNHEKPVSLYLTVPPSDMGAARPLMRLFLNQALRKLCERMEFEGGESRRHYKHRLLLMLDEFPALGRLPFFSEALAYIGGYGIRAALITQDLAQHQGIYGREESITANCHTRVAYAPNKTETAELLSAMTGDMTVHQVRLSTSVGAGLWTGARATRSDAETRRRLLTPEEAMRLPKDEELVFVGGLHPIRANKAPFFEDVELVRRTRVPAPAGRKQLGTGESCWDGLGEAEADGGEGGIGEEKRAGGKSTGRRAGRGGKKGEGAGGGPRRGGDELELYSS